MTSKMNHRNGLRDLISQLKAGVTQGNTIIRFNRPLLSLLALGILRQAQEENPFVPAYLMGQKGYRISV